MSNTYTVCAVSSKYLACISLASASALLIILLTSSFNSSFRILSILLIFLLNAISMC
jgi:hypothetical protein